MSSPCLETYFRSQISRFDCFINSSFDKSDEDDVSYDENKNGGNGDKCQH